MKRLNKKAILLGLTMFAPVTQICKAPKPGYDFDDTFESIEERISGMEGHLADLKDKKKQKELGKNVFQGGIDGFKDNFGKDAKDMFKDAGDFFTSKRFPDFMWANKRWMLGGAAVLGGGIVGVSIARHFGKKAIDMAAKRLNYMWKNPNLIEDTDCIPLLKFWEPSRNIGPLDEVEGTPELREELGNFAKLLKESRGTGRGSCAMFFGKPGTGKTFSAKRIARAAGMRYAIVKGNVIADCKNPIDELDKKIQWAKRLGILLVVDEADALICRGIDASDSKAHRILNHFISVSGDPEDRPNMILITNKPETIDPRFTADGGRIDTAIMFPDLDEAAIANILERSVKRWATLRKTPVSVDFAAAARGSAGDRKSVV